MDKLSILKEIDKLIQEFNDKHNPKWKGWKFLEENSVVEDRKLVLYCDNVKTLTTYYADTLIKDGMVYMNGMFHDFHTDVMLLRNEVLRDYLTVVDRIDLLLKEY